MRYTHLPIESNLIFTRQMLEKATKISFFEKICLWFIKPKSIVNRTEGHTLIYKDFRGKRFILNHFHHPPVGYRCRCSVIPIKNTANF